MARMTAIRMAFVSEATDVELIQHAEQETHDLLVELLRGRRRDAVVWRHYPAAAGAKLCRDLDALQGGVTDATLLNLLDEHSGAVLVVATCTYEDGK